MIDDDAQLWAFGANGRPRSGWPVPVPDIRRYQIGSQGDVVVWSLIDDVGELCHNPRRTRIHGPGTRWTDADRLAARLHGICVVSRARRRRDPLLRVGHAQGLRARQDRRGQERLARGGARRGERMWARDSIPRSRRDDLCRGGRVRGPVPGRRRAVRLALSSGLAGERAMLRLGVLRRPRGRRAHRSRRDRIRRRLSDRPIGGSGGGGRARSPGSAQAGMALSRAVRCEHRQCRGHLSPPTAGSSSAAATSSWRSIPMAASPTERRSRRTAIRTEASDA